MSRPLKHGGPILRRLPKHLRANREALGHLRHLANALTARYGLPVWLCGSALADFNARPRDWDLRIEMPDEQFTRMFGDWQKWQQEGWSGEWSTIRERWAAECVKQTGWCWKTAPLNIDFQIYPVTHCRVHYRTAPKLKLTTIRVRS